jgi:hypothetical protein
MCPMAGFWPRHDCRAVFETGQTKYAPGFCSPDRLISYLLSRPQGGPWFLPLTVGECRYLTGGRLGGMIMVLKRYSTKPKYRVRGFHPGASGHTLIATMIRISEAPTSLCVPLRLFLPFKT